ncbi:MAG: hypothetical protein SPL22_10385 [Treponema sp.]|uniref:hypothetical protein n=1 Tax=Treponema sp. TaxID=166 RepID=UPI002A90F765|nr:hypothetical protein [Treponema sp.]MDY6398124.1 hypothetical protein [Treponema sp.]
MKNYASFNPLNSEVLVFIGAGATASLGMPQTATQTKIFRDLSKEQADYKEVLEEHDCFSAKDLSKIVSFLKILDGNEQDSSNYEISASDIDEMKNIYRHCNNRELLKKRILELRHDYDWNALKKILSICPLNESHDNLIRDVFSLIDKKLLSQQALKVKNNGHEEEILPLSRLQGARNFLILFINMLFAERWYRIANDEKSETFEKYKNFLNTFGKMMQEEGHRFYQKGYKVNQRDFYLFSTSFVSFNFEMVFPWILMNSHRELNTEKRTYIQDQPMKLWLDFGVEHRGRKSDDEGKVSPTLEFTESVASRENEESHIGTPLNRAGKFYFAHGSSNWRECPACGRMTFFNGGNLWDYKSKKLIPPFPIQLFESENYEMLTEKEKEWHTNQLHSDSMQCMHCGSETFAYSAPMIMQSLYKSIPTSFLEEIQRNVRVSLEKARHIILFGYQLPPDDTVWQQTFAEAVRSRFGTDNAAYCTVVVGNKGEDRWLYDDELANYVEQHRKDDNTESYGVNAIENVWAIFGKDKVRAWTGGIPQVFGDCTGNDVKELFYPKDFVNWARTRLE